MQNKINKIFLFLGLFFNQIMLPASVLAQEITPTPTEEISPTTTPEATPTPEPTATETPIPTLTLTPTPTEIPEEPVALSVEPVAEEQYVVVVVEEEPAENSTIETGGAVAVGNVVNSVNTTSIDSTTKVFLLNSVSGEMQELDLNSLWKLLATPENQIENNFFNINNYAELTTELTVTANTGDNAILGGTNNLISTGNAYALANVINLVNSNFIGSRVFVGVINIDASALGDIILPNPGNFVGNETGAGGENLEINNYANIESVAVADSNTGNNEVVGEGSSIITGNSVSMTNVSTMANFNLINSAMMMVGINNLGSWNGNIYNWLSPGSVQSGIGGMFLSGILNRENTGGNINILNFANIFNNVSAVANTGNNTIVGGGDINTGNAYSVANIANMANLNIVGSDWFYGMVNIIGDWNGNAIFAYPDMAIDINTSKNELALGDELLINVTYENKGYDDAKNVKVGLNLPYGLEYVDDNSGKERFKNGSYVSWTVGDMGAKTNGGFVIRAKAEYGQQANKLIKQAIASEESIPINANVSIVNTEVTLDNNNDSTETRIIEKKEESNLLPKLVIEARNNVNDFVYQGDTVQFEIKARNEGEAKAYKTYLVHRIIASGGVISENRINIGDVAIGGNGKVTFGIPLNFLVNSDGKLLTETVWVGERENGEIVTSNISTTEFLLKSKTVRINKNVASEVQAVSLDGEILGDITTCLPTVDKIPYILLFVLSSLWMLKQIKKWQKEKKG